MCWMVRHVGAPAVLWAPTGSHSCRNPPRCPRAGRRMCKSHPAHPAAAGLQIVGIAIIRDHSCFSCGKQMQAMFPAPETAALAPTVPL